MCVPFSVFEYHSAEIIKMRLNAGVFMSCSRNLIPDMFGLVNCQHLVIGFRICTYHTITVRTAYQQQIRRIVLKSHLLCLHLTGVVCRAGNGGKPRRRCNRSYITEQLGMLKANKEGFSAAH